MVDTEYISKDSALACFGDWIDRYGHEHTADEMVEYQKIEELPAADVVPWEWLERYADYFCAGVSMPEFVREAKMFYASTNEAMQGGVIDG